MGQQHGVGRAVGDMEVCPQLMRHAVVQAKSSRVEGQTRQRRRDVHLLPGVGVVVVQIAAQQVTAHDLNGLLAQRLAELVVSQADAALHRVGKHVHTGVGGDGGGHALDQLHVQNGLVGEQGIGHQRILRLVRRVGDDAEARHLTAGAAGGGDRNKGQAHPVGIRLHGDLADGLGGVNGAAAAHAQDAVRLEVGQRLHAQHDLLNRGIGHDLVKDAVHRVVVFQRFGDQLDEAAGHHEGICHDQRAVVGQCLQAIQGIRAEIDLCFDIKFLHGEHLSFKCNHYNPAAEKTQALFR